MVVADPCTRMDPSSFCLDSGLCSGGNEISCIQAYIRVSTLLVRPLDHPIVTIDAFHGISQDLPVRRTPWTPQSVRPIPDQVSQHMAHRKLIYYLGSIEKIMTFEFPYVEADISLARNLWIAAQHVRNHILPATLPEHHARQYRDHIMSLRQFSSIQSGLEMGMEFIASTDRTNHLLRQSLMVNYAPYVHSWLLFHHTLGLPAPFEKRYFLDFVSHATIFDDRINDVWALPEKYLRRTDWFVLPLYVTTNDEQDFPVAICDMLGLHHTRRHPMDHISTLLKTFKRVVRHSDSMTTHDLVTSIRAILFYMRHHPSVSASDQEQFCSSAVVLIPIGWKLFRIWNIMM